VAEIKLKVSVITACLNSAETIEATIRSVLCQDCEDVEYIIVDGGSTDGTSEIIARYAGKVARVISGPDRGVYEGMNKGVRLAKGKLVCFLNSDDTYAEPTVLREMVEFIDKNGLDAAYGDLLYVDRQTGERITRFWKTGEYEKGAFALGWAIPHPAFFCRRDVFEKYGYFDENLRVAADFELMLRFIEKHKIRIGYLPKVAVKMRTGGKSSLLSGIIRGNREIVSSFRLNNMRLSPWFFICKPVLKFSQVFSRPT